MESIGIAMFMIGLVCAMIWIAALVLWARDRFAGDPQPVIVAPVDVSPAENRPILAWLRCLIVPFAVLAAPGLIVVVLILAAPLVAWEVMYHFYFWCRFRLFGTPIPVWGPIDEVDEATS